MGRGVDERLETTAITAVIVAHSVVTQNRPSVVLQLLS